MDKMGEIPLKQLQNVGIISLKSPTFIDYPNTLLRENYAN
jgi:hypothetical protein